MLTPGFYVLEPLHQMLTAHGISKSYNLNTVLEGVTFSLNHGDRVGLIGPNGCGKTTLVEILAGREPPDDGYVEKTPRSLRVGYLEQSFRTNPERSLDSLLEDALGSPATLAAELERLAAAIADHPDSQELQTEYDSVLQRIESHDPTRTSRKRIILGTLGLDNLSPGLRVGELSGGQKTRLGLALVLLDDPDLLLLDEPTNHLDIAMLEWLEGWLLDFTGRSHPRAALIISHDRTFLDRTATRILDLDPEAHRLREYPGGYSAYLEQVTAERELQMAEYKDQVYEIRRMKQDIARTKQQSLKVELSTTSRQPGVRRIAKKVARKAKSREKKLNRYLRSDERVEKPKIGWQMKVEFEKGEHIGQDVLEMEDLAIGYVGHPELASELTGYIRAGERIALMGPNGSGKTTLLRTIAGVLEPKRGRLHLGSSVRLGYMAQEGEMLDSLLSPLETIQSLTAISETDARSFLHYFLFSGDDALRPARELSFGERSRLMLASLIVQGCNFLLLDEPINHLDIPSRERFEGSLAHFDGTILAVVHDRYFIQRFASRTWEMHSGGLTDLS